MQVGLTGHKAGIGKAFYELYKHDYVWVLLDRNEEWACDVRDTGRAFDHLRDVDIFINNVYCENTQSTLFDMWSVFNQDKDKLCVNIGSVVANTTNDIFFEEDYYKNKLELHTKTHQWNSLRPECKASLVVPAFCDTDFAGKDVYKSKEVLEELRTKFHYFKKQHKLLKPESVAKVIKFIIDEWESGNHINTLEMRN